MFDLPPVQHFRNALEASLIFEQHEAGSAIYVDPTGWKLTYLYCFSETEEEYKANPRASFRSTRAWDAKRVVALPKITIESKMAKLEHFLSSRPPKKL